MQTYKRLLDYIKPHKIRFITAIFFLIMVSATTGAIVFFIKPAVDEIFIKKDYTILPFLPIIFLLIMITHALSRYFASYTMQSIGISVIKDLRNDLYRSLQSLSISFFPSKRIGNIVSRITNDANMVQDAVSTVIYDILKEFCTVIVLVSILFYRDWQLTLFAIVVFPFAGFILAKIGIKIRKIYTLSNQKMADLNNTLYETLSGIKIIKTFSMENKAINDFKNVNSELYKTLRKSIKYLEMPNPIIEIVLSMAIAAILWIGADKIVSGETTVGTFLSFLTGIFMLHVPTTKLARSNNKVQQAIAAANRIFEYIDARSSVAESKTPLTLENFKDSIELRNLSFTYPDGAVILNNINLKIKKGEMVALVGASGAGKTTLVNLIPRLFDPTSGDIFIDGINMKDLSLKSLRSHIGLVSQDIFLFADTIRNNISFGTKEGSSEESMITASKTAISDDFIMKLENGYDTNIGEQGLTLSYGQRQRISIARCIMKNPSILIFDEATSALDSQSEKSLQDAIENLLKDKTSIVIAHRLSTIIKADRILVLDKGKIVEEGTHKELLKKEGLYKNLYDIQFAQI